MNNTYISEKNDNFEVKYEVIDIENFKDNEIKKYIKDQIEYIDKGIDVNNLIFKDYRAQIKKFTNQANALDYTIAIGSGILAGIVDSFFVGNFSFKDGKAWSNHKVNDFVMNIAKKKGYKGQKKMALSNLD